MHAWLRLKCQNIGRRSSSIYWISADEDYCCTRHKHYTHGYHSIAQRHLYIFNPEKTGLAPFDCKCLNLNWLFSQNLSFRKHASARKRHTYTRRWKRAIAIDNKMQIFPKIIFACHKKRSGNWRICIATPNVFGWLVSERLWSLLHKLFGWLVSERLWSLLHKLFGCLDVKCTKHEICSIVYCDICNDTM